MIEVSVRYSVFVVSGVFYVYATSLQEVDGNNSEDAEVATSRPVDGRSVLQNIFRIKPKGLEIRC